MSPVSRRGLGASVLVGTLLVACGSRRGAEPVPGTSLDLPSAGGAPALASSAGGAGGAGGATPAPELDPNDALGDLESGAAAGPPGATRLEFRVTERGPGQPWLARLVNRGEQQVRLVADMRLLTLDVTAPGKKKAVTCRLPEAQWPSRPERRLMVDLAPGEGVAQTFDPRLYCFSAAGQDLLVPGARVTAHFGWTPRAPRTQWKRGKRVETPSKQVEPFVATQLPLSANSPKAELSTDKQLDTATFALHSSYAAWSSARLPKREEGEAPAALDLAIVQGSDAGYEHDATVEVSLVNRDKQPQKLYFRRELVSYEVTGPDGIVSCNAAPDNRAPDKQAFITLPHGAKRSYASRLAELCPRGTFSTPGLYLVYARLDATEAGERHGFEAFTGTVVSEEPGTVRVRTGESSLLRKYPMTRIETEGKPSPSEPRIAPPVAPAGPAASADSAPPAAPKGR